MAKKESYLYPVIAEGDWGCAVSRSLKNKLLCYFQSLEKSGGGECKIEPTPGNQEQITVYFAAEEGRCGGLKGGFFSRFVMGWIECKPHRDFHVCGKETWERDALVSTLP